MREPEERLIAELKGAGVDLLLTLPCDRVKGLMELSSREITSIPLAREEEGVGISAGAAMAGRRAAMLVQSSGVGNMVNAIMSLTYYYGLPLAVFVSQRGVYREGIAAQEPMGRALPRVLEAIEAPFTKIDSPDGFDSLSDTLDETYDGGKVHFFLLSPAVWEASLLSCEEPEGRVPCEPVQQRAQTSSPAPPPLRRFEILKAIAPVLKGKAVVCNLGIPAKELYSVLHQPSNFYMLGSMGMATPIGLGAALSSKKEVFVIDGDGSLLMNPGTLATVAYAAPRNLKVIAIDNASYGSTGSQPTHTSRCVDLMAVARGFGIKNTIKASEPDEIVDALSAEYGGPLFVHALSRAGNEPVGDIPLEAGEIRDGFSRFLRG